MPMPLSRPSPTTELPSRLDRLDGLPLRPRTARGILEVDPGPEESADSPAALPRRGRVAPLDPGWRAATSPGQSPQDPLAIVARRPWWKVPGPEATEALTLLWRRSVATSFAAARLARDAGFSESGVQRLATAGLLAELGVWAAASVDPDWLVGWTAAPDGPERQKYEQATLGTVEGLWGRRLATRWGLDPLVAESAWLIDRPGIDPKRSGIDLQEMEILRGATLLVSRTPWSRQSAADASPSTDPRVKMLTAEVQARCSEPFLDDETTPHEERLTRENAGLRLRLKTLTDRLSASEGLVEAMASDIPIETPEQWADRASRAWCGLPGVSAARVEWEDRPPSRESERPAGRAPDLVWPLEFQGRTLASVELWTGPSGPPSRSALQTTLGAWASWASVVADRASSERRLESVVEALGTADDPSARQLVGLKLDALAEFAAGAGHELNNPLAVVVGRAQLLIGQENDPRKARSLRAILNQAQRAHRILRDLMYVARPPQPRMRYCQPDEVWRQCLRDATAEAADRGVQVVAESLAFGKPAWTDPDGLRHLAEVLLRNAMEATPAGGTVKVATSGQALSVTWTVQDNGKGLSRSEAEHLFDPFFCGRQAGRGLGMGLPRASRFLSMLGGEIRWQSLPGQGATFTVRIPLSEPPDPVGNDPRPTESVPGSRGWAA